MDSLLRKVPPESCASHGRAALNAIQRIPFETVAESLAATYCALPDSWIEVSFAAAGDKNFKRAMYFESLTAQQLIEFTQSPQNVAVLVLNRDAFLKDYPNRECGKLGPRNGANKHVLERSFLVVEFDGKDLRKDWATIPQSLKREMLQDWARTLIPKFKGSGLPPTLVVMSGNGLHFYLKVKRPIDCSDSDLYRHCYKYLLELIKWNIADGGVSFDENCANAGRAIRLPGSVNDKSKDAPIQTEVWHHDSNAHCDFALSQIWENAVVALHEAATQMKTEVMEAKHTPHLEKLRNALTFPMVAEHFGYQKLHSVKASSQKDEFTMSSPWVQDKNPSFCFNEKKKIFIDWAGKLQGNIFTFLALMAGLNVKTQFKEVVKLAEEITGIDAKKESPTTGYFIKDHCHVWVHSVDGAEVSTPLANFECQVVSEELHDDGLVKKLYQRIEATHQDGASLPSVMVPTHEFFSLNWVSRWGSRAIITAGQGLKDRLRQAIQEHSKEVQRKLVYTHVGWRQVESQWLYLHAGGAIGKAGNHEEIAVHLGGSRVADYRLPDCPEGEELKRAVRSSLELIELDARGAGVITLCATFLSPLSNILLSDFCVFFSGQTGNFKTCLTALSQAHFGMQFNDRHLPGNWSSTENSLERMAFITNSAVFVVDDFNPRGSLSEIAQYHKKADRLIRAAGNQQGRDRMDANTDFKPQYHPRCLLMSSGEDIPKGHSLRARLLLIDLKLGDIPREKLASLQGYASSGLFAQCMSGYIRFLSLKYEALKIELPKAQLELREKLQKEGEHRRNVDTLAKLVLGLKTFLKFAVESGAISEEQAQGTFSRGKKVLFEQSHSQTEIQSSEDPVDRFFDLLRSAFIAKKVHLVNVFTGREPDAPELFGWAIAGKDDAGEDLYQRFGEKIGWAGSTDIYLDPNLTFNTISRILRDQNDALPVTQQTLWKRLKERGLLSADEKHATTRKVIEGMRMRVLHISIATLFPSHDEPVALLARLHSSEKSKQVHEDCNDFKELEENGPVGPIGPTYTGDLPPKVVKEGETEVDREIEAEQAGIHFPSMTPSLLQPGPTGPIGPFKINSFNNNKIEEKSVALFHFSEKVKEGQQGHGSDQEPPNLVKPPHFANPKDIQEQLRLMCPSLDDIEVRTIV